MTLNLFKTTEKEPTQIELTEAADQMGLEILTKTIGLVLEERDGIVVHLKEKVREFFGFDSAIVFRLNNEIGIMQECQGFAEGQRLKLTA
jgi:hypothetical protein